jgi:hypothetical protein
MAFTAVLFAGFCVYLLVAGYLGKTLAAYSADAKSLSAEIERQWSVRQSGPVRCIVISERKVGASAVLFVKGRPDVVDFSSQNWATPRQIGECRRTGAIAALLEPSDALDHFPSACRATKTVFDLRPLPGFGNTGWPVELVYIPPEGEAGGCDARR